MTSSRATSCGEHVTVDMPILQDRKLGARLDKRIAHLSYARARLDLGSVRAFWLAAIILISGRLLLTRQATRGLRRAGAEPVIRDTAWRGLISQGGVTLGLVLLIQEAFPQVGADVVALGMAVIIGNILGGPILLKQALSRADPADVESGGDAKLMGTEAE